MKKAVSNREICFVKAVFLFCKHGHFFHLNFASYGVNCPPPPPNATRVKEAYSGKIMALAGCPRTDQTEKRRKRLKKKIQNVFKI